MNHQTADTVRGLPLPADLRSVEIDGTSLAYRERGAGEPVVFRTPSAKVAQSIVQLAHALVNPDSAKDSPVRQAVKSVNGWLAVFHG